MQRMLHLATYTEGRNRGSQEGTSDGRWRTQGWDIRAALGYKSEITVNVTVAQGQIRWKWRNTMIRPGRPKPLIRFRRYCRRSIV